jgi:AhpD family alkylhydroperoxidase
MGATAEDRETREQIQETLGLVPGFFEGIPEEDLVAEWPTFQRYTLDESEIPPKYRELMGLAVAANTKCPYCQYFHSHAAKLHGATDAELEEAAALSSMTARWSAMIHAQGYDIDRFEDEIEEIGEHLQKQMESGADD